MGLTMWKPVVGYEGLYWVSTLGYVRSKRCILQMHEHRGRYYVGLTKSGVKKTETVSRLVAMAFLGPDNGLGVRHLNDVGTDDRVENLAWGTQKQNMQDRMVNGHCLRGSQIGNSKLTEVNVKEIKKRLALGEPQRSIAKDYGVSQQHLSDIRKGEVWGWL